MPDSDVKSTPDIIGYIRAGDYDDNIVGRYNIMYAMRVAYVITPLRVYMCIQASLYVYSRRRIRRDQPIPP